MAFFTLGEDDDLQLEVPTIKEKNWGQRVLENLLTRIVEHDHTGSGKGRPIGANSLANDGIDGTKLLLNNNESLRAKSTLVGTILNLLKLNTNNNIEVEQPIEKINLLPISSDPTSPIAGDLQLSDGTHRAAGLYSYDGTQWVSSPNTVSAINTSDSVSIQIQTISGGQGTEAIVSGTNVEIKSVSKSTTKLNSDVYSDINLLPGQVNTTSTIPYFSGLTIGNKYRIDGKLVASIITASSNLEVRILNGTNTLDFTFNSAEQGNHYIPISFPEFTYSGTDSIDMLITISGSVLVNSNTYMTITEIDNEEEGNF